MRVITGSARNRRLKEPADMRIRPTTDKVKEALFNIIQFDIEGRRVLDLFAGTGQLGIEALSRGAREATFVDQSREAVALVRDNLKTCGFTGTVVQSDSVNFLRRGEKYDLIFIDPPYDSDLLLNALSAIYQFDILSEGGIIVCESRREMEIPVPSEPYFLVKTYQYSAIKLTTISR